MSTIPTLSQTPETLAPSNLEDLINAIATEIVLKGEYSENVGDLVITVSKSAPSFIAGRMDFEVWLYGPYTAHADYLGGFYGCAQAVLEFREIAKVAAVAPFVAAWHVSGKVAA